MITAARPTSEGPKHNLLGQRFGMLLVIEARPSDKNWQARWLCRCDCGKQKVVYANNLRRGLTMSCGCRMLVSNQTHGQSGTLTYSCWEGMIARCHNPNNKAFKHYGGRGIRVCERWLTFECFLEDMGEKPKGRSLDRIDNDSGYEPTNCRWVTQDIQMRNTRKNRRITFNGETLCVSDWATRLGLAPCSITRRLDTWGTERALSTPKSQCHDRRGASV